MNYLKGNSSSSFSLSLRFSFPNPVLSLRFFLLISFPFAHIYDIIHRLLIPMATMDYSTILSELDHAVKSNQPRDILQFCSDFFHTKLAQQRQNWMEQESQAPFEGV